MNRRRRALLPWPLLGRRAAPALGFGIATAVVAVSVGLAGCTPAPAPKPTPTPLFASKAEAFKAAEQVYRDYVDAGNANRNGIETPDATDFLVGSALESSVNSSRELREKGLTLSGEIRLLWFSGVEFEEASSRVKANACVDVSGTRVDDVNGADVTPAGRALAVPLSLRFDRAANGKLVISSSTSGTTPCETK